MASLMLLIFLGVVSITTAIIDDAAIDTVIKEGIGCHETPGLAVAVVKDGKVVMSRGYGVSNVGTKKPVTNTTLFEIASLSKMFTTALLSKILHDNGSYSIKTNVHKILGRNKFNNTLRSVYATVEDLMAHRMGIPRNNIIRLDNMLTRDNLVDRVKYLPSEGGFRDSFYYSDLMYGILTHITETVGGKSWEDSMIEKIFTPLHMDSSTFGTRIDFSSTNIASPYVEEDGQLKTASTSFVRQWAMLGGSSAVVTNANDMSKWMLFHLSGGKNLEGVQIMEEELLKETYKPRNALSSSTINKYFRRPDIPVTMSNDGYGLGLRTGYYRGLPIVQHSGSTYGYRSFLTLMPDKNIGVFMAMTGTDDHYWFRGPLMAYLMDVALGETPWINSSTICTFPSPWYSSTKGRRAAFETRTARRAQRATSHALPSYAGVYRNEAYGNIGVHYDSSSHTLQATYGMGSWVLTSLGGDRFKATWNKPAPTLDFDFTFTASGGHVFKLIPNFEVKSPPSFYRIRRPAHIIG